MSTPSTVVSSSSGSSINSLVVAVEGNIGAGKSTFLDFCSRRSNCAIYPEPVDTWESFGGENVLANFYSNPARWAVSFQLLIGMSMQDVYKKNSWKPLRLIERSLLSSRHIFLESMIGNYIIEPAMAEILKTWYSRTLADQDVVPHAIGKVLVRKRRNIYEKNKRKKSK